MLEHERGTNLKPYNTMSCINFALTAASGASRFECIQTTINQNVDKSVKQEEKPTHPTRISIYETNCMHNISLDVSLL